MIFGRVANMNQSSWFHEAIIILELIQNPLFYVIRVGNEENEVWARISPTAYAIERSNP